VQERFADAHLAAVEHRASQEPLDDVLFLVRARIDVLVHGKRTGPHVVGDPAEPPPVFARRIVLDAADLAGRLDQRPQDVDVVVRLDALHHRSRPLQAHARVDVLARQRPQVVGRVAHAVELREDQVPDLHVARFRAVVDLAARSADAVGPLARRAGRPEVFVLADAPEPLRRELHVAEPDTGRFVVVEIDRRGEPPGVEPEPFLIGQKLPRPDDGLALEIVAEAEVAQHLEERVMISGPPDVVDVAGSQTLLASGRPGKFELAPAQEMIFELVHAGGREEDGRVPSGDEYVARAADTALGLEEGQVFFAEFVGFHRLVISKGGQAAPWVKPLMISASPSGEKPGTGDGRRTGWVPLAACQPVLKRF